MGYDHIFFVGPPKVTGGAGRPRVDLNITKLLYLARTNHVTSRINFQPISILFGVMVYMLIVPILIFFFLYDKEEIHGWFKKFFPEKLDLSRKAYAELDLKIGNYIRCKLIEIIIVWFASTLFFALFGLNYALLLGFLCGLSVIIPYVGAIAVTIPIMLIAYFQWGTASDFWYILIIHLFIQVIDGNVVVPVLFSDAVNLHPLAILISILFFGTIWGIWGVFFAIPLAVLMNTLLNIWPMTEYKT